MARANKIFFKKVIVFVCFLLLDGVTPSAIEEHQESLREKDVANNLSGKASSQENHSGDKLSENKNILTENKSNQYIGATDSGNYNNQDSNKKLYDDNKYYGGQAYHQDSGERDQGVSSKKGHKKGHHNTGFHNSYHKDESSNKSSYFDDFSDEADESNHQKGRGKYGNEAGNRYSTRKEDGLQYVNDNSRQGNYDRRGGNDARNMDHYDYNRNRYQDDRRDLSEQQKGQNYAARDRGIVHSEAAPSYHGQVPYHQPEYRPRPPVDYHRDYYDESRHRPQHPPILRRQDYPEDRRFQKITIYEDPRVQDPYNGRGSLREHGDLARLEVRPGGQRYQRYDNYYESRRPNWGVNRRSQINPLVFNYNRY